MPDITKLLSAIDQASDRSYGDDEQGGELGRERAFALDYYYGRNIEPAPEGRSQVVDRSVFETIQWILPSLCRIFANGDNVVEFVPTGEEDEEQAQQESDYLNYLVTQKNPWFQIFLTWAQDALQLKNGYCMAYIEDRVQVETEAYEKQSEEAVALLMQDSGVEIVEFEEVIDEDAEPSVIGMDEMGQPILGPAVFYNLTIKRTKASKRLRFKVLPPERCKIAEQTDSFSLQDCDYFEYWDYKTISSLRQDGFDVPDDIAAGTEQDNEVDYARDLYDETLMEDGVSSIDPAMRLVKCRMVWIRHDYDEDGISELQKVIRVGQEVLKYKDGDYAIEQCSRIPVASITPTINPHRHIGVSIADLVIDVQRIQTAILRAGLDSMYLSLSPRHVISDKVNLNDMSITAPGYNVRLEDGAVPGEGHILPLETPFVFPEAMAGLEYFDQVKEKRTGASKFSTGVDPDILNKSPSGVAVNQLSTMAAQRIEQIARIFASGVEYLFAVAHELVLKSGHQTETVKLRNQWVQVDPAQWRTGRDMRIVVGYGAGNKDALVTRLMAIANFQKEAMMGGLRIVTEDNVYETAIELTKASDFSAPERFWTDPSSLPPPEPQPSETEIYAQVEAGKQQSQERIKSAEIQQDDRESERKVAIDKYRADLDAEVKIYLEQIKSGQQVNLEEVRARFKNEPIRLETQKIEQAQTILNEILKSQAEQTAQFGQMLQEMLESMNAPREIVKGKDGKVAGIKVNGKTRPIKRNGQGEIVGLQ